MSLFKVFELRVQESSELKNRYKENKTRIPTTLTEKVCNSFKVGRKMKR